MIKKISMLLATIVVSPMAFADAIHCQETYQNTKFVEAVIWSDTTGFGPAECQYEGHVSYALPKNEEYYPVHGNWKSTMPGFQWCKNGELGNTAESCQFAKKEK